MRKAVFILVTVLAAFLVNSNCAFFAPRNKPQAAVEHAEKTAEKKPVDTKWHNYGAYLAGRTALIHADLNEAAYYFMIAEKDAPESLKLTRRIAVMLAMTGRVDQAADYVKKIQTDDNRIILNFILSSQYFKEKHYRKALAVIDEMKGDFVYNMLSAWCYAAMGEKTSALKALEPLNKDDDMQPIYYFQSGAICDLSGDNACANDFYQKMINGDMHLAYLPLLTMVNFYLRTDNLMQAVNIVKKNALHLAQNGDLFRLIDRQISDGKNVKPILTANIGLSDTLLNIAGIAGKVGEQEAAETVLLLTALADYVAPDYVVPRVYFAQKLESLELWQQAVDAYARIKPNEPFYNGAQMETGEILKKMKQYDRAAEVLSQFKDSYPHIYAEALYIAGKPVEAIEYFKSAVQNDSNEQKIWPINLAIGICYSKIGDFAKTEEYLRKVIQTHSDAMVQNFLGYILLQQNKNIEEAFTLIVSAYNALPHEGTIVDSLGWAFYKIGRYKEAEKYLETAVDLSVSEAVIYDHLGDVYWQNGRHDEAIYQWNHALALKDSSGELKRDEVLNKIKNGLPEPTVLPYDADKVESIVKSIAAPTIVKNAK